MAGCCKSKSTFIMYTVNLALLLLGIVVAATAGVTLSHRGDLLAKFPAYANVVPAVNMQLGLAAGILLVVVGICGLCGAKNYESCGGKIFLILYILFLLIVLAIEIAAAAMMFALSTSLTNFSVAGKDVDTSDFKNEVNKLSTQAYDLCCNATTHAVNANKQGCKLISDVLSTDTCASKDAFTKKLLDFIKGRVKVVGIVTIVVAVVQFFTLIASCCLLCRGKDEKKDQQRQNNGGYYNQGDYVPPASQRNGAVPVGQAATYGV